MSYRFKDSGPDMRPGDGRMMGMDDKLSRDMDDLGHGSRPPFGRGRRMSPGRDKPFPDRGGRDFGGFGRSDMSHGRDRSPLRRGFDDRFNDRFKRDDISYPRRDEMDRKDLPRSFMDEPDSFSDKFMDRRSQFDMPGGFGSRYDMPDDHLKSRAFNLPSKAAYNKSDMMKPNECEIIIINKHQRAYGESVEARMKNLGIQVDILFLKDEALLVQTIDDIARRGCLYAMVISPLNETHRSVTLNILYGTPQEHRNMPLDDALKLIARNFHDHIRSQREIMDRDKLERGFISGSFPADREIQFLLRLLADGRQLSIGELETVIKYLTDRKDKMKLPVVETSSQQAPPPVKIENTPTLQKSIKDDIDLVQKEQDLQNRIMSIMNQGPPSESRVTPVSSQSNEDITLPGLGDGGGRLSLSDMGNRSSMGNHPLDQSMGQNMSGPNHSSQSGMSESNQSSSTYINFDNPSVKKALDSLMQSGPNLLKSLSGANSLTTQSDTLSKGMNNMGNSGGPQRGDMGPQGGNLPYPSNPQNRNMGPPEGRHVGPGDNRNMGPPEGRHVGAGDNRNMGQSEGRHVGAGDGRNMSQQEGRHVGSGDGRNMGQSEGRHVGGGDGRSMGMNPRQGPNFGPNMSHRQQAPFQDRPGMYGSSNMTGNRPHYMGNQGMGGGPRRY